MGRLKRAFDNAIRASRQRTTYLARQGKGDSAETLAVSGRTGYVWARVRMPEGEAVRQVRCRKARQKYNAPVLVRVNPVDKEMEVTEEDPVEGPPFYGEYGVGNIGAHATSHGLYGGDTVYIEGRQHLEFLTHPLDTPNMYVYVRPYIYPYGTVKFWPGGSVDLSAYVPTSPYNHRLVVVGINGRTNTSDYITAASQFYYASDLTGVPFDGYDVAAAINAAGSPDFIPSAAVRLRYGQSTIQQYDVFYDCRAWAGVGTVEGRIKISANDDTFGYLAAKLTAGAGASVTEVNDGGNETLAVAVAYAPIHLPLDEAAGTGSGSTPTYADTGFTNWTLPTWAFDQSNTEQVDWLVALPGAATGITATLTLHWTAAGGTPGQNVLWRAVWRVVSDDDALTAAGTTDAFDEDALLATNDDHAISKALALTGWSAGDALQLRVQRYPSGESTSLASDALLLGAVLEFS